MSIRALHAMQEWAESIFIFQWSRTFFFGEKHENCLLIQCISIRSSFEHSWKSHDWMSIETKTPNPFPSTRRYTTMPWNWYFFFFARKLHWKSMILCVFNTRSRLINGKILQLECRQEQKINNSNNNNEPAKKSGWDFVSHLAVFSFFLSFFHSLASHVPTINSITIGRCASICGCLLWILCATRVMK